MKIYETGSYQLGKVAAELSFEQQLATLTNSAQLDQLPILRPYTVGFQTLYKNDDNTEGVGVGIYMIGKQVIYIPAFYRNNTLKTCLFMVLADTKQFRPATEEWIDYIRVRADRDSGELADISLMSEIRRGSPNAIRARDYLDPIIKTAAIRPDPKQLYSTLLELAGEASSMSTASPMDLALEMGKHACKTLVDTFVDDPRFFNDMMTHYTPVDVEMFKDAALSLYPDMYEAKPAPGPYATLVLPLEPAERTLSKAARQTLLKEGFYIKTADANYAEVFDAEKTDLELRTIDTAGVYHLMRHDKDEFEEAMVFKPMIFNGSVVQNSPREGTEANDNLGWDRTRVCVVNDHTGTDKYINESPSLIGIKDVDSTRELQKVYEKLGVAMEDVSILKQGDLILNPASGSSIVFDCWRDFTRVLDGNQWVEVGDGPCCSGESTRVLRIFQTENTRKFATNGQSLLIPAGCRVIHGFEATLRDEVGESKLSYQESQERKAKAMSEVLPGYVHLEELNYATRRIIAAHYNTVRVESDGLSYTINEKTQEKNTNTPGFSGSTKEAALHLVNTYHVNPDDAVTMLKKATPDHVGPTMSKEYGIAKKAISLSNVYGYERGSSPYDIPNNISAYSRHEPGPEIQIINTEGRSILANDRQHALDMIHRAAENGVKEVMDASVLKMLMNTGSPSNLVGDYMKDLTRALDKIGRILMLMYSHADDFEEQYGDSKMQELIETLMNAQNNLSDAVMFLKTKSLYTVDLTSAMGGAGLASGINH